MHLPIQIHLAIAAVDRVRGDGREADRKWLDMASAMYKVNLQFVTLASRGSERGVHRPWIQAPIADARPHCTSGQLEPQRHLHLYISH